LIDRNIKGVGSSLECLKSAADILGPLDHQWHDFETKEARGSLGLAHFKDGLGIANVEHDC